jgi:hypothetical protein
MIDDYVSLIPFGTIHTFVICVISIAYVGRYIGLGTVIERLLWVQKHYASANRVVSKQ